MLAAAPAVERRRRRVVDERRRLVRRRVVQEDARRAEAHAVVVDADQPVGAEVRVVLLEPGAEAVPLELPRRRVDDADEVHLAKADQEIPRLEHRVGRGGGGVQRLDVVGVERVVEPPEAVVLLEGAERELAVQPLRLDDVLAEVERRELLAGLGVDADDRLRPPGPERAVLGALDRVVVAAAGDPERHPAGVDPGERLARVEGDDERAVGERLDPVHEHVELVRPVRVERLVVERPVVELRAVLAVERRPLHPLAAGGETGDEHVPRHGGVGLVRHEGRRVGRARLDEVTGGLELQVVAPVLAELVPAAEGGADLGVREPAVDRAEGAEQHGDRDGREEEECLGEPFHRDLSFGGGAVSPGEEGRPLRTSGALPRS